MLSRYLCLSPLFSLLLNGWLVGFVAAAVVQTEPVSYLFLGLLPHGIFELPAMIIAQAAALSFGTTVIIAIFRDEKRPFLMANIWRNSDFS